MPVISAVLYDYAGMDQKGAQDDMPLARKITLEIWCLYFLPIDVLSGLDFRDGKSIAGIMVTGRFKILLNRILKLDK